MAPAVVDELEAVEIEEYDGDEAAIALGPGERLADAVSKEPAVRQRRQFVVQGLAFQPFLGQLPFGDVPGNALDGDDPAVLVAHEAQPLLDPHRRARLAAGEHLPPGRG